MASSATVSFEWRAAEEGFKEDFSGDPKWIAAVLMNSWAASNGAVFIS